MSKKFHGWFDLTDKAAESLQTDNKAKNHIKLTDIASLAFRVQTATFTPLKSVYV